MLDEKNDEITEIVDNEKETSKDEKSEEVKEEKTPKKKSSKKKSTKKKTTKKKSSKKKDVDESEDEKKEQETPESLVKEEKKEKIEKIEINKDEIEKEQKKLDSEVDKLLENGSISEEISADVLSGKEKDKKTEKFPKKKSDKKKETGKESSEKSTKDKDKKKKTRKTFKIDINKSPKLKKIVQDIERIEDAPDLKRLRDNYNHGTRDLINKIKKAQTEISNIRSQAMEYRNKRDSLNKDVQEIKKNKLATSNLLNDSRTQLKDAKIKARKTDDGGKRKGLSAQIGKSRRRIDQLEKRIETEDLELKEENQIVDEIDKLERSLQELLAQNKKPDQFNKQITDIRNSREELRELNNTLREKAEESQNYHLLYLDISKEMEDLRTEKRSLQRELNENRYIADVYHQRLIEMSQKLNRQKRISRKSQYQNKKKVKKEIQKMTLEDAREKMKKGVKLNIFEARAFLEEQANRK